jgi:hypothetical protein
LVVSRPAPRIGPVAGLAWQSSIFKLLNKKEKKTQDRSALCPRHRQNWFALCGASE